MQKRNSDFRLNRSLGIGGAKNVNQIDTAAIVAVENARRSDGFSMAPILLVGE